MLSVLLLLAATAAPAQEILVRHTLSFPERQNQYVRVLADIPVSGESVEIAMPNWTPGSYVIRDYSANLERLQVTDPTGQPVPFLKVAKNRWRVDTGGTDRILAEYHVWAGELHVSHSWVENDFALINGAGIFLYSDQSRDMPQQVTVELPSGWSRAFAALPSAGAATRFLVDDFDELVDSPIVAGNMTADRFEDEGQSYALIDVGETGFWDSQQAVGDLTRLVRTQQEFWGVNPFDREYLFFNFLLEFKGGLEHDHSTVMMSNRWAMRDRAEYIKWLALASHEFFHSWNVRRMRPEILAQYDYDREVYVRELWLAEGFTSYYDNLLLFRAGLINVSEYFEMLALEFRNYETVPGRQIRSVELASFDSWIKHYVPDANSVNSTASYYRRGGIIGFVTDAAIRRQTDNDAGLDTVMQRMYQQYGPEGPGQGSYPPGAFEQMVEDIAGPEVRAMVERLLRTGADPDIDAALDWFGLTLNRAPVRTAKELANQPPPAGLGISWTVENGLLIIDQVVRGRSGAAAGILPGDEILAINGQRLIPSNALAQLNRLRVGDRVEVTVARHGQLLTLPVDVEHAIPESYTIALQSEASRREKARLEAWLGIKLSFTR